MVANLQPSEPYFARLAFVDAGLISRLLTESCAPLLEDRAAAWTDLAQAVRRFEDRVFSNWEAIGRRVFLTCLNERVIGFGSYEACPELGCGQLGFHCIRAEFRGRGFGKSQVREIIRRLQHEGCPRLAVAVSDHSFFAAARQTYRSCGFREVGRAPDARRPGHTLIRLELDGRGEQRESAVDSGAHHRTRSASVC